MKEKLLFSIVTVGQIQILMKMTTIYSENWYFCSERNKIIVIFIGILPS